MTVYSMNVNIMDKSLIFIIIAILFLFKCCYIHGSHPPRIIEHPIDTTVPRHEPATLNCKAEGSPIPSIQWYKDGVPLKILPGSHRIALPAGGLFFLKVVNSRRETDAGIYWCEAKNELGTVRSRNATLQVAVLREEFRIEPQNTRTAQGDTVILECAAPRGNPEPIVLWKKNGQLLDFEVNKRMRIVDGGNLAIQDARQSDEGQYQCIAKNLIGVRESTIVSLKVHVKPYIIRGPHDQTVLEGASVTFPCRVGGDPMPDVLWLRTASGGNMPLDRVSVLEDRSLRLERVTVADEGEYSCEADNIVGAISAMGTLAVYAPPKFLQRPTSKSVELNADTSFECRASGNPKPTIFWTVKNRKSIIFPGAPPLDRFHSINTENGHSILTLTKFQRTDKDLVIICNAINEVAAITTRAQLTLDSQEDRPPPIIIMGPVNQTLPVKSVATLHCKAIGLPNPTISWFRDGIPIHPNNKINLTSAGDLIISDLDRQEDQGLYTCVASSRTGKSTWSGFLRIEVPTNPNIKFYRAPEQSKCPTAPGQPKVLNASVDAITIVWPSSDKTGAAPLLGYSLEMYSTNKSKTWIPIASRLIEPIFTVDGLTNGASYLFIVRAENSLGFSPPSPISETITAGQIITRGSNGNSIVNNFIGNGGSSSNNSNKENVLLTEVEKLLQTNDIVELLEANASDSTSIHLVWDIDNNGQYIEGFYIYARELHSFDYKEMTVLNTDNSLNACTVNGLQRASTYEFFLVPFYKSIIGKPSNARYASTLEDVPDAPPHGMEAIQFNRSSVFLKWLPPQPNNTRNGVLISYNVIVKGLDTHNTTRIYKNMTIDATTPTLLLANLTTGVTYYIEVAAATKVGIGPYSKPAILRMDPRTQSLDTGYTRYPINRDIADDFLTQTWFIILLGSIIAFIVFLFGALILFRRYQFIKQTSLSSLHGNHAISSNVRKFPTTLQLNGNNGSGDGSCSLGNRNGGGFGGRGSVWIDSSGGIWRQNDSSCPTKETLPDYAQITGPLSQQQQQHVPLPDYERLTPLNMPDYAEVACSTFKSPNGVLMTTATTAITTTTVTTTTARATTITNKYDNINATINNLVKINGNVMLNMTTPITTTTNVIAAAATTTTTNMAKKETVTSLLTTTNNNSMSLYDSCGAYATTNVVANVKSYQNRFVTIPPETVPIKTTAPIQHSQAMQSNVNTKIANNITNISATTITTANHMNEDLLQNKQSSNEMGTKGGSNIINKGSLVESSSRLSYIQDDNYHSTNGTMSSLYDTSTYLASSPIPSRSFRNHYNGICINPMATLDNNSINDNTGNGSSDVINENSDNRIFSAKYENNPFTKLPAEMTESTASTAILSVSPAKTMVGQDNKKLNMNNYNNNNNNNSNRINITENRFDSLYNEALAAAKSTATSLAIITSTTATRTNPFNSPSVQSQRHHQQLLVASNVLKQGLGAYANTTLATQMINGGGAGTLRRPRHAKIFKSDNNINFGDFQQSQSQTSYNRSSPNNRLNITPSFDILSSTYNSNNISTHNQQNYFGKYSSSNNSSSSTNYLLNDWSSSSATSSPLIRRDYQPQLQQYIYGKGKDGTWSDYYYQPHQTFKEENNEQQQQSSQQYKYTCHTTPTSSLASMLGYNYTKETQEAQSTAGDKPLSLLHNTSQHVALTISTEIPTVTTTTTTTIITKPLLLLLTNTHNNSNNSTLCSSITSNSKQDHQQLQLQQHNHLSNITANNNVDINSYDFKVTKKKTNDNCHNSNSNSNNSLDIKSYTTTTITTTATATVTATTNSYNGHTITNTANINTRTISTASPATSVTTTTTTAQYNNKYFSSFGTTAHV